MEEEERSFQLDGDCGRLSHLVEEEEMEVEKDVEVEVEEEERSFQLDGDCGRLSRPVAAHHHFSSSAILHLTSHHTTDTVYIVIQRNI